MNPMIREERMKIGKKKIINMIRRNIIHRVKKAFKQKKQG